MMKRVIVAGLLGGLVLMLWVFIANGIFGFRSRIDMKAVPNERLVYQVLKESIVEPGGYVSNPPLEPGAGFPGGEPVFSIRYSGLGHEAAGRLTFVHLTIAVLSAMIAAWLLWIGPGRTAQYSRRVLFVAGIGLLFAIYADLPRYDIGGYPLASALLLAAFDLVSWTLIGLVVAWRIRPERHPA